MLSKLTVAKVFFIPLLFFSFPKYIDMDLARLHALKRVEGMSAAYDLGSVVIVSEEYDDLNNVWLFLFSGGNCDVYIIVDRDGETDVGGTTGCKVK